MGAWLEATMKGICPKCGWETRELGDDECDMVTQGRYRCSGTCLESSVPNQPQTFPPRLRMKPEEPKKEE